MDIIDVAAGLVFRAGLLLITQRQAQTHLAGLWEFPGGKREAPESFEECLVRELQEELGIEVSVGALIESLTHAYPEKTIRLNFYRCEWVRGEPQLLGCAGFRWIDAGQLQEFEFPPADARLLERLRSDKTLWHTPGARAR
jgi:mutator protein MutT